MSYWLWRLNVWWRRQKYCSNCGEEGQHDLFCPIDYIVFFDENGVQYKVR